MVTVCIVYPHHFISSPTVLSLVLCLVKIRPQQWPPSILCSLCTSGSVGLLRGGGRGSLASELLTPAHIICIQ